MNRKKITSLILGACLIIGSVFVNSNSVKADQIATNRSVTRIWGADRFDTAISVSDKFVNTPAAHDAYWPTTAVDTAIIANGFNYPDALAAAPLTRIYNSPILLSEAESLNPKTEAQLKKLNIKKVVLIGGTGVLSQALEDRLHSLGMTTERFGGTDRYETSLKIADRVLQFYDTETFKKLPYHAKGITIATTHNFTDALSVASYAIRYPQPIVLIPEGSNLHLQDISGLKDLIDRITGGNNNIGPSDFNSLIVGSTSYMSENLWKEIPEPVSGNQSDPYTLNIVGAYHASEWVGCTNYLMASAENFPDALSGTALAGKLDAPIIYAGGVDNIERDYKDHPELLHKFFVYLNGAELPDAQVYILGGTGVVPDGAENKFDIKY